MSKKEASDFVQRSIERARISVEKGRLQDAWSALIEAHIISQPYPWLHTVVHWRMLGLGIRERNFHEIRGQVIRLLLASPGSWSKRYPIGNTGRSDVSMFEPMPIPEQLKSKVGKDCSRR